jgi:(2Fe-2S) ferredoxin
MYGQKSIDRDDCRQHSHVLTCVKVYPLLKKINKRSHCIRQCAYTCSMCVKKCALAFIYTKMRIHHFQEVLLRHVASYLSLQIPVPKALSKFSSTTSVWPREYQPSNSAIISSSSLPLHLVSSSFYQMCGPWLWVGRDDKVSVHDFSADSPALYCGGVLASTFCNLGGNRANSTKSNIYYAAYNTAAGKTLDLLADLHQTPPSWRMIYDSGTNMHIILDLSYSHVDLNHMQLWDGDSLGRTG